MRSPSIPDLLGDLSDFVERLENISEEFIPAIRLAAAVQQLEQLVEDAEADESTADEEANDSDDEEEAS